MQAPTCILYLKPLCLVLSSGQIEVTNDGATILRNIGVDNPAAKILVDISKTQDDEVRTEKSSVVLLVVELSVLYSDCTAGR